MKSLRLTDPLEDLSNVRPSINLAELLMRLPRGTKVTSFVGEALPAVFGPTQTYTCKFLYIDDTYYFGGADWLEDCEVGSYVEISQKNGDLRFDEAPYPMARFDLGTFVLAARTNLTAALSQLRGRRQLDTGIVLYDIDKTGPGNGTRILVYDIPNGVNIDAFRPHVHMHGECFYVVEGMITDEHGSYPAGQLVVVGPNTFHTPRAQGRTVIVVMWTGGTTSPPPP